MLESDVLRLVEVLTQQYRDRISWSIQPHNERDKGYTDNDKEESDEPFD
jgi:hypothetical protein